MTHLLLLSIVIFSDTIISFYTIYLTYLIVFYLAYLHEQDTMATTSESDGEIAFNNVISY